MTTSFVEQDLQAVFWQTVCQQTLKTKFFYLRRDLKTGHGRSTCLLPLYIIFAIINTTGIMRQNHKNLWITGKIKSGFVRVLENLESPGILFWHFPGLESPGKKATSPGKFWESVKLNLTLEASGFKSLYGGQFTLSTQSV